MPLYKLIKYNGKGKDEYLIIENSLLNILKNKEYDKYQEVIKL